MKLLYKYLFILFIISLLPAGLGACESELGPVADAGPTNSRLVLLSPPGDTVGLEYNGRVTLRARYENAAGQAASGVPLELALVATSERESTAGSTLSATEVITDELGVARVDLTGGAAEATFRVSVDAPDAPTEFFHINISEGGFARLFITPTHEGWRELESFTRINVRLYRADALTCASLDIDALPDSLAPPRSLSQFGGTVSYLNVNAGQGHAIVTWSEAWDGEDPRAVGIGCLDLGAEQLPNGEVRVDQVVADRDLRLGTVELTSVLDLAPVAAALAERGAERPWQTLACPAGPGQLLLDCALDAAAPDGAVDCVVGGSSSLLAAVAAQRGALDAAGCRGETLPSNQPSLDRALSDAVAAGASFPVGAALGELLAARATALGSFSLTSELSALTPSAGGHRALAVVLGQEPATYVVDLAATSLPVLDQRPLPVAIDGNALTIGAHGFTLRYGRIAHDGFTELGLTPAGLAEMAETLGTALALSVRDSASNQAGCAGVSALVCRAVGEADGCLAAACSQGAAALDPLMTRWSRELLASGLDFALESGSAQVADGDDDLVVDTVGGDGGDRPSGTWSAGMTLADGAEIMLTGELVRGVGGGR